MELNKQGDLHDILNIILLFRVTQPGPEDYHHQGRKLLSGNLGKPSLHQNSPGTEQVHRLNPGNLEKGQHFMNKKVFMKKVFLIKRDFFNQKCFFK